MSSDSHLSDKAKIAFQTIRRPFRRPLHPHKQAVCQPYCFFQRRSDSVKCEYCLGTFADTTFLENHREACNNKFVSINYLDPINQSGAGNKIFWDNWVNAMSADDLAPCVTRSSAAMELRV